MRHVTYINFTKHFVTKGGTVSNLDPSLASLVVDVEDISRLNEKGGNRERESLGLKLAVSKVKLDDSRDSRHK